MSVDHARSPYIFIIQTDEYTGNFERELTGYVTGVDDGTHGDEQAVFFNAEVPKDVGQALGQKIDFNPDDNGYDRCCSIWNSVGRSGYEDMAIFFHTAPTAAELNLIASRAKIFAKDPKACGYEWGSPFNIIGFQLINRSVKVTDDENTFVPSEPFDS